MYTYEVCVADLFACILIMHVSYRIYIHLHPKPVLLLCQFEWHAHDVHDSGSTPASPKWGGDMDSKQNNEER